MSRPGSAGISGYFGFFRQKEKEFQRIGLRTTRHDAWQIGEGKARSEEGEKAPATEEGQVFLAISRYSRVFQALVARKRLSNKDLQEVRPGEADLLILGGVFVS
jgi:hypothetical protein